MPHFDPILVLGRCLRAPQFDPSPVSFPFCSVFFMLALAVLSSPLVFQKGKIQTDPKRKHTQPNKKPKRGEKNEVKKKKKGRKKKKEKEKKEGKKKVLFIQKAAAHLKQNKTKQNKQKEETCVYSLLFTFLVNLLLFGDVLKTIFVTRSFTRFSKIFYSTVPKTSYSLFTQRFFFFCFVFFRFLSFSFVLFSAR